MLPSTSLSPSASTDAVLFPDFRNRFCYYKYYLYYSRYERYSI